MDSAQSLMKDVFEVIAKKQFSFYATNSRPYVLVEQKKILNEKIHTLLFLTNTKPSNIDQVEFFCIMWLAHFNF